ncbi:MAG: ABC transporter permease [Proteobacteria bacterium]|nr:ABC transporter permease [Pseudomonadota bacterium]MBI3500068.1 ABC transporter permease [Pseudomonadota bacterium]
MTAIESLGRIQQSAPVGFSARRVGAMVLRHLYLLRGSWVRLAELAYWPLMQMVVWGFITQFFMTNSNWVAQATGVLLAAALLWDVLFRSQLGVSMSFLEELWSRNLGNLFVTPLKPYEFGISLLVMSVIRTLLGMLPAALLAIPLYHYSVFTLGLPLIAFFSCLMAMGWSIGLAVSGLVLRYGMGAESLAWVTIFAFAPVSGVYYPISVLPGWLQYVAWATPSAYVFEGMRAVLFQNQFRWDLLAGAVVVDGLYMVAGIWCFLLGFAHARRAGKLLQQGE